VAATFGIDFGTTNSLIAVVRSDPETGRQRPFIFLENGRPHPSVVWYHGGTPVAGRRAMDQLSELGLGVFGDIVRSPKMYLGSPAGIPVGGVTRHATDVVADLLRHLRANALDRQYGDNSFERAVVTIPVTMRGQAREDLRQAALKAGIRVHQFVHEPLAALYGHLRSTPDFRQELAGLEGRLVLVFDWGGGTLDLTLCQVREGLMSQVLNAGDRDIGGDFFDLQLRQLVRQRHEDQYPNADLSRLQPHADARLIQACEDAKIRLSARETANVYVPDLLASPGGEKDLQVRIERGEFEESVRDLVRKGLSKIESLLEAAGLHRGAVEFCLATGGMVSMPAIREGLREIFGLNRLRLVENAATVIAEGAAWIAHDNVGLQLAKPIELLHADNSYIKVFPSGTRLPNDGDSISQSIDMYCVDPSDGLAKFYFARPTWPGNESIGDERTPLEFLTIRVDRGSQPFLERLQVEVIIDHNLIANVHARSLMKGDSQRCTIHDLEFGLNLDGAVNGK